jgi:ubiquinone/menaquinone biosynthesis C-methylase UbiE
MLRKHSEERAIIHPVAQSYDLAAEAYERGRPDYPAGAVSAIVQMFGVGPESTIVDLAAGTGKFTRLLVPTGANIVAVEPMEGMRAMLQKMVPGVVIVDGTAEAMPLPTASANAVTVAQAFHWFRPDQASSEIHRVLRAGGGLALLWNRRDLSQPLQQAIHDIVVPYRPQGPPAGSLDWKDGLDGTRLFAPLQEYHFAHSQFIVSDGLLDRILSFSYIASLASSEKDRVRNGLRALTAGFSDRIELRYETSLFITTRRDSVSP